MLLKIPQKMIRAAVIRDYMIEAGYLTAVCFSCGNAADALRECGVHVIEVSPNGPLRANRWMLPAEVHVVWPHAFDATSGHLPLHLMIEIAKRIKDVTPSMPDAIYEVPTGSGETIMCLRLAYPYIRFRPVRDGTPATESGEGALEKLMYSGSI